MTYIHILLMFQKYRDIYKENCKYLKLCWLFFQNNKKEQMMIDWIMN